MDASLAIRIAIVVAAALLLGWIARAFYRQDWSTNQHMLDAFLVVLGSPRVGRSPWGYECIDGTLDAYPARVSLLPDSLITRTLPTLWLEFRWARRHDAWLCVILAANGMEYFAEDVDEGNRLVAPAEWPEGVVVRGKGPESVSLARRLRDLDLSAYKDLKMITLSESETKVIMRCARGDVSRYRVLRSADFAEDSVTAELVTETVRVVRDVERTLRAAEELT